MNLLDTSGLTIDVNANGEWHISGTVGEYLVDQTLPISGPGDIMFDPESVNFYFIPVDRDSTHLVLDMV